MGRLSNRRNRTALSLLGLGWMAAVLAGCSLLPVEEQVLKPSLVEPAKATLSLYVVKRANIAKQITGVATLTADKMDYLYFEDSGNKLESIHVKLGDAVQAGDVVATTETGDLEMKIRLQEIAVEKSQITLQQQMMDKSPDDPEVRLKKLDLQSAHLQLESLRDQLKRSKLTAKVSGIVTFLDPIQPGDSVTAYKQLVTISDPSQMKLVYTAGSIGELSGVEVGMDAEVKIKGQSYAGKVVQTPLTAPPNSNKAIQEKNNKSLTIDVKNLPPDMTIGAQADLTIVTEKRDNALVIPRAGLRSYMGRDYVLVLDGESRKEIDVEKGIVAATEVEILKGITEGQQIILSN
ncbi:efflux RND transporter periplasmic adaptor subunit [Paenibacillus chartarius]|uniref:Efflux RND transporter periplasmic adaptor subunit n=1 Tax=Paenibacillus chartarius TaxID=747481 RepID=A0ABV6DE14_9BACL